MSRRGSLLAAATATALAFALFAWVSSAGSVQMLQAPTVTASPPQLPRATPPQTQQNLDAPGGTAAPTSVASHGSVLGWVLVLLVLLIMLAMLVGLALLARWAWRERWHRPQRTPEVSFDVLAEVSAALAGDADAQLAALQEGSPRNAIVACWLRLEKAAGQAGVPHNPAETSAEFTARVLGALAVDSAMINGFANLYREARFSRHELGEPARRAAIAAVRSLHDDIEASGIPISPGLREQEVP